VGSDPNASHPGEGINFTFGMSMGCRFLDDYRAWGPQVPNFKWQLNTWYWLRLSQTGNSTDQGSNIFAKVWLADGTEPEPADWQLSWARADRTGLAGIQGPSGGAEDVEVDYVLIKAAGLPSIKVAPKAFTLVGPRIEAPKLSVVRSGNNVVITWTGGGVLEAADKVTGPWLEVIGATSPYSAAIAGTAKFFRVRR
jgi:hypothetical protein